MKERMNEGDITAMVSNPSICTHNPTESCESHQSRNSTQHLVMEENRVDEGRAGGEETY